MKVTIRDVAREAGVSVATVSRVCNDGGSVSEATRRRVLEVARRLRYSPDAAARTLSTRRTSTFGLLLPDLYGEFFSEVIRGVDQTARRHGYQLLVSSSHSHRSDVEAALRAMRGRVDGLIAMWPDLDPEALAAELPESMPVVLLNSVSEHDAFDVLTIDNMGGARDVVRHLLGLGHRAIATICGPQTNHDAAERLRGYRLALEEGGIPADPKLEVPGHFTERGGHDAMRALIQRRSRPTAVFAANDSMAIGALSALHDAGLGIPDDVAVAGFDDIPLARFATPPLTTVHVPIHSFGARAVEWLLEALASRNRHARRNETLPTTLAVRRSCGGAAPARADRGASTAASDARAVSRES